MRPSDWSVLSLSADPTPGDPQLVLQGGENYAEVADAIDSAAQTLRQLDAGDFQSEALTALMKVKDGAIDDVGQAEQRYRAAAAALSTYARALDQLQTETLGLLWEAQSTQANVDHANQMALSYDRWAANAEDEVDAARYRAAARGYRSDVTNGRNYLRSLHDRAASATAVQDRAANDAINSIEATTCSDGLEDNFWDKLVAIITDIAGIISSVAGILAFIAAFIPIIGPAIAGVLLLVAAVAAIINAVGNTYLAIRGERSWTEAVFSIIGAVLSCVGFGAAAKVTQNALRGATTAAAKGQVGERLAGVVAGRARTPIFPPGSVKNFRLPDLKLGNLLGEVKNVISQALTRQLLEDLAWSGARGPARVVLFVRQSTHLTAPLAERTVGWAKWAFQGGIKVQYIEKTGAALFNARFFGLPKAIQLPKSDFGYLNSDLVSSP